MKKNYSLLKQKIRNVLSVTFVLLLTTFNVNAQYCIPTYGSPCSSDDVITYFELGTLSNSTTCSVGNYGDYTALPAPNLYLGLNYQAAISTVYGSEGVSIWIDFNDDFTFDPSERVGSTTSFIGANSTGSVTVTLPFSANSGTHRLRARLIYNSLATNADPCISYSYGEAEDYLVNLVTQSPCSGSPIAGDAVSTLTVACTNTAFDLNLINNGINTGLTYQWQSSPNGITWSNTGSVLSDPFYSVTSISSTTYYQCVVTCTSFTQSTTSTPVTVNLNPMINCYCKISLSNNNTVDCTQDKITDFSIANVISQTTNCDAYGYSDSTASNYTTINLSAGNTYTFTANTLLSGFNGDGIVGVWIDYNQNAIFDPNEFTSMGYGPSGTYSNTIAVPFTALGGSTRMRVMLDAYYAYSGTVLYPCTNGSGALGQVLDYKVNMTAATACSGAPNVGDATSTKTAVCQNESYQLDLINNSVASNITYQWQSSLNGTTWANLGVVQNTIPYSVLTQSLSTYYRCVSTCTTAAPISSTSTPVIITQNLPTACYCVPQSISCISSQITNVTFETINDSPICGVINGYNDNTVAVSAASVTANQTYSISLDINSQSGTGYVGLWIDYDQNGIFDANEYNFVGSTSVGTLTTNITVPFTAIGGNTRMRIKMEATYSSFNGLNPCSAYQSYGQTLDYMVNITASAPCLGVINAGNAIAPGSVCSGNAFTLDLANNDIVSGATYQWFSSPNGTTYTAIGSLQNTVPYEVSGQSATTYYMCTVTCPASGSSNSSINAMVTMKSYTACYCIPDAMDCTGSEAINYVAFATMTNTSTCNAINGYSDFTGSVPSSTTTAGQSYTLTTVLGNIYGEHTYAWIDYNQDGIFDSSEYTDLGSNSGNDTISYSILIPITATPGTTRMRVRNITSYSLGSADACITPNYPLRTALNSAMSTGSTRGETEDYLVTILAPDCSVINIPPSMSLSGTLDICPGSSTTLDLSTQLQTSTGLTYQWKYFNGSSYVNSGTAATSSSFVASPTVNTSYYCEILCNGNPVLITDTVMVNIRSITTSPTYTDVSCFGGSNGSVAINATTTASGALTYSWTPSVSSADLASGLIAGTYSITIVNSIGCVDLEIVGITEPPAITVIPSQSNVSCFGLMDGVATVTVTGGISPLNFSWLPSGGTGLIANNLAAGAYTFNISDGNGCVINQTVTIIEPSALTVTVSNVQGSCLGGSSGQAEMLVSGGTPGYNYNWTSGGSGQLEINLPIGSQTCTITDANFCTLSETVAINASAANFSVTISGVSSICEQLEDSITSNINGGSGSFSYSWLELPTNATSVNPNFTYTTSVGTYSYNLTVTDNISNCVVNSNSVAVQINPSSNFSGTVTTSGGAPVSGRVVLFKYLPFYTKFDSVAGQNIGASGDFLFTSFTSGTYIIKAVPTATNMQIAYGANPGDTAVAWKDAKQILHGCSVNDVQNIFVPAFINLSGGGTGLLSGRITQGIGYDSTHRIGFGHKPTIPGGPIGGIIVKGGKNPGGQMFVQTVTNVNGDYSLGGLPPNGAGESYFILVDIPGLDTNNTYHKIIISNDQFTGLNFVVDSAKINPVASSVISVHDLSAIENEIKVFPNPASNFVSIQYNLKNNSLVKIELFDMLGRSVKMMLPEAQQGVEIHKQSWQTNDLKSGLYFIKMTINGSESVIKLSVTN